MNRKGFTLIELLIAMVVASIVMAAMYSVYRSQTRTHRTQQLVVQMQQNMRAALYLLESEIRMAGYSATDPPAPAGFVQDFTGLGSPHNGSDAATDANNIAFTVDRNDSGTIDAAAALAGFEIIAFRRDAANNTVNDTVTVTHVKVEEDKGWTIPFLPIFIVIILGALAVRVFWGLKRRS